MSHGRKSPRMMTDIRVQLFDTRDGIIDALNIQDQVLDISNSGLSFKTKHDFEVLKSYNTDVIVDNQTMFKSILKIVRKDTVGKENIFGCRFINIEDIINGEIDDVRHEIV